MTDSKVIETPSASEALYTFIGWLTTRAEIVTLSASHHSGIAGPLIDEFCKANNLAPPRDGWEKGGLKHPNH